LITTPSPDWIAACHESSHATGAYLLGVPVNGISILGDGSGEGRFETVLSRKEIRERGLLIPSAVVGELGRMAERKLFGQEKAQEIVGFDALQPGASALQLEDRESSQP
jgi:hypothetical protein